MTTVINYAFGAIGVVLGAALFLALMGMAVTLLFIAIGFWVEMFRGRRP